MKYPLYTSYVFSKLFTVSVGLLRKHCNSSWGLKQHLHPKFVHTRLEIKKIFTMSAESSGWRLEAKISVTSWIVSDVGR